MTDDIVARLRVDWSKGAVGRHFDEDILLDAADEIERLREALKAMMYAYPYRVPCFDWEPKARAHSLARAAISPPAQEPSND